MKRFWPIAISLFVWAVIVWYVVWSSQLGQRRRSRVAVSELSVTVSDSARIDLLDGGMVRGWITGAGLDPTGKLIGEVGTREITECIMSRGSARSARVYVDLEGTVHVSLTQRNPVMRVIVAGGYDFYITEDRHILPARGYAAQYIPVVTGEFGVPFDRSFTGDLDAFAEENQKISDKNYIFLCKLINFVNYTGNNDFWRSQIVQINATRPASAGARHGVSREPEVEFIPRIGDHVVQLGRLDGFEEKLERLMIFYRQSVPVEGWGKWKHINLKYDGQVVCR